jgi:hypothetical protein
MSDATTNQWAGLERLRSYAAARKESAAERCEFCGVGIEPRHGHLVNVASRTLLCVCRPCYLLFTHEGAGGSRFRAVPERYHALASPIAEDAWDRWQIPIGLAFFFRNSETDRITAFYPSPAGAIESELGRTTWDDLVRALPELATLEADVEALLVRREDGIDGRGGRLQAFIVPIDVCYELVGRIRRAWRGFHGGDDVRQQIDAIFARIADRAGGARGAHADMPPL